MLSNANEAVLTLNDLYQYVFGDWSSESSQLKNIPANKRENALKRLAVKQQEQREKFKFITSSPLSNVFRQLLRAENSKDLEVTLYGNNEDNLEPFPHSDYEFPNKDAILKEFELINSKYNFILPVDKTVMELYVEIFKACKLFADYVELNNNEKNQMAYLNAYKILILFGQSKKRGKTFENFETYIKRYGGKLAHPVF